MSDIQGIFLCDDIEEYQQSDGSIVNCVQFHAVADDRKLHLSQAFAKEDVVIKHMFIRVPAGSLILGQRYNVTISPVTEEEEPSPQG